MNDTGLNRAWKPLLYFCKLALFEHTPVKEELFDNQSINWQEIITLSTYHSIRPLLFKGLMKWKYRDEIPVAFLNQFKILNFRLTAQNLNLTKELTSLIKLLRTHDIEIIPYKGTILANVAYNDLGAREFGDIDLLFQLKDFKKMKSLLLANNFRSRIQVPMIIEEQYLKLNCEYGFEYCQTGKPKISIDTHWFIGNKLYQIDIGYQAIKPFTERKELFGTTINVLSPEGLLLTTCLHHGGNEQWQILKYMCDVAAILDRFGPVMDWELLLKKSRALKVVNLVLLGVGITSELFDMPLPKDIETLVASKRIQKQLKKIKIQYQQEGKPKDPSTESFFQGMWFHIKLRANWITKFNVVYYHILRVILPNIEDIKTKELSKMDYWLLFLKKPFRLWKSYISQRT